MSAPRLVHLGLSPAEWLRVHGHVPPPLQEVLVDDHLLLSDVVPSAKDVLELLDWSIASRPSDFTASDQALVERFRTSLGALAVGK
jgi:hypothetical protein